MAIRVLCADDDPDIRALVANILGKDGGCEVLLASDGEEALALARQSRPDIVFLDIVMPKKHGWEVCEELKSDPTTQHIKVVMLTAITQASVQRKALGEGADDYLVKPFKPAALVSKVEGIRRRHLSDPLPKADLPGSAQPPPQWGRMGSEDVERLVAHVLEDPEVRAVLTRKLLEHIQGDSHFWAESNGAGEAPGR